MTPAFNNCRRFFGPELLIDVMLSHTLMMTVFSGDFRQSRKVLTSEILMVVLSHYNRGKEVKRRKEMGGGKDRRVASGITGKGSDRFGFDVSFWFVAVAIIFTRMGE